MGVKVDCSQLRSFAKRVRELNGTQREEFFKKAAKSLAAQLLALVKQATPTDTGYLRSGWDMRRVQVTKEGNEFRAEVINPIEYASYVEYGHRTRNRKGWVDGQFFLTLSEEELSNTAPAQLEEDLLEILKKVF